jgi:hypothetical protein
VPALPTIIPIRIPPPSCQTKSNIEFNVLFPVPEIICRIKITEIIAIGSLAADSISVIEETFLFIDLVRRIEKTAAASVDDIIAHISKEIRKGHPEAKLKTIEDISAVISTPAVARSMAGLATGLKLWLLVLKPPA